MHASRHILVLWRQALLGLLCGVAVASGLSLMMTRQYAATIRVLVTQPSAAGLDPYTAIKSTEGIAARLSELVYTTTFFDNVLSQKDQINRNYFYNLNDRQRRKLWRRTVTTEVSSGTGILSLTAYHADRAQARLLVDGVAREMATQAPNYFGSNIRVQIIDAPLDSRYFARPNLIMNLLIGGGVGLLMCLGLAVMQERHKHYV